MDAYDKRDLEIKKQSAKNVNVRNLVMNICELSDCRM